MSDVLRGKVALVTGGTRGIGAATARRLAADGAHVAITYSSSADKAKLVVEDLRAFGVDAAEFGYDLADVRSASALVADVVARFGGIDVLVSNAGVLHAGVIDDAGRDHETTFAHQFAVNVEGVVALVSAATATMTDGGRIVLVGSSGAARTPFPGIGDYVASKAAVAAYARAWARDLGGRGIAVNVVQPGVVDTDMSPDVDSDGGRAMIALTALGRMGQPDEVANLVAYLAGPSPAYLTGSVLTIDGGMTV
ncbi:SDR family NAD(P)-dependent oxidoreductase [Kutzneria sp. CA-103260]|uniref:SDR family NAD(P)-dependent oxidoreductase n=1 Tax=Kutzneria sp. CA-103260 TaxID=2802641 RepID=UPI001BA8305B|nr:SDR family oxidoreductase [Kutzneria sp. CA-103260]QUQ72447.1 oxidoreductase [Kutzneria sp. CA-103260]